MDRRVSLLAAAAATLLTASACQDYNFNPVGHCLIQPGTRRVTLSDISTADVLFVVDDSGSMAGEQAALGTEFPQFLDVLARSNRDRVTSVPPQDAVDFHIAVTTTASYYNEPPINGSICSDACPGAEGQLVCCLKSAGGNLTTPQPPLCDPAHDDCATASGFTCKSTCTGLSDVASYTNTACCDAGNDAQPIACDRPGQPCGIFDRFYYADTFCSMSYASATYANGAYDGAYPAGRFMADLGANAGLATAAAKGKVLHFDRTAGWASWDWTAGGGIGAGVSQDLKDLASAFDHNVQVGTCGSPQEQGLEAARRAVKAQLAQDGLTQPGVAAGDWLHGKSKLVVVWISDEDDCSAPYSAGDGVVFPLTSDGCVDDSALPLEQQRQTRIAEYADYFTSLGRPFGAAFIASSNTGCVDASCTPLICTNASCTDPTPGTCGGQGVPTRYLALAAALRARGVDVVTGSICDAFGTSLGRIAKIVKPPDGLVLPTQPAAGEVTVLRIARPDGSTRKTCKGPAPAFLDPPTNSLPATYADAVAGGFDWWFTETSEQVTTAQKAPTLASKYVYINHLTNACEAQPRESYSADYLGQLPTGGCTDAADCASKLGGAESSWECLGATAGRNGTCVCN